MVSNTNFMHESDQYDINSSDDQRPKKNRSPYLLFKKLHRQEFIDANPELTKPELIQKISAAYLLLSQVTKIECNYVLCMYKVKQYESWDSLMPQ